MDLALMFLLDVVAITVMTFGLYFPRRRKDMVVAFLVINLGLLAVTVALGSTGMSIGLGFGLFAVLSIIRLLDLAELDQQEVAYYFASLAIGLLGGFVLTPLWLGPFLMAVVLLALYLGDHPRLFAQYRVQSMTLDGSWTDEPSLITRLEELLGGRVHRVKVRRVDLVEATTSVEVRYQLTRSPSEPARIVPGSVNGGA